MSRGRKIGIGLAVVIGLFMLWVGVEHWRGVRAVAAWEKAAKERGEKLTVEELTPPKCPPEKNAAGSFMTATFWLDRGTEAAQSFIPVYAAPGKVVWTLPVEDWRGFMDGPSDKAGTNLNWQFVHVGVNTNATYIANMQAALQAERLCFALNYSTGFELLVPHLTKLKSSAQWLSAAALVDLREGRRDGALRTLRDAAALARMQHEEPLLISQLVRYACATIAINATWQALQAPGWTAEELAALQHAWDSWSLTDGFLPAIRMERAFLRAEIERSRTDPKRLMDIIDAVGARQSHAERGWLGQMIGPAMDELRDKSRPLVYGALWRTAWSHQDEFRCLEQNYRVLTRAGLALTNKSLMAAEMLLKDDDTGVRIDSFRSVESDYRFPVSTLVDPQQFFSSCAKAVRTETQREMLAAAIALKRHQLKHGKYPDDLKALVPEFLKQLPIDSMDGKALRYRTKEDGTYLLYSIGEDGKDNGGDATKLEKAGTRTRDIVWPWPATEMEVEAFVAGRKGKRK